MTDQHEGSMVARIPLVQLDKSMTYLVELRSACKRGKSRLERDSIFIIEKSKREAQIVVEIKSF